MSNVNFAMTETGANEVAAQCELKGIQERVARSRVNGSGITSAEDAPRLRGSV